MPLSGLLSGRYPLELLLHLNSAGVLDHYQHSDCTAQLLESVCRCQFLLVYVRHDTEFLWAESYFRTVSPSLSRTVSNQPLSHVYHSFGPLCHCGRDPLFLEPRSSVQLGPLCFAGGSAPRRSCGDCPIPDRPPEISLPAAYGYRRLPGVWWAVLEKSQKQTSLPAVCASFRRDLLHYRVPISRF